MCSICFDSYPDCPVCRDTPEYQGVTTQELHNLGETQFKAIRDSLGFRWKHYNKTVSCVNWHQYQAWRNKFIRDYGDSTLCVERTVYSSGYNECKFYVWNDKYLQEKREYFNNLIKQRQQINQFLGL